MTETYSLLKDDVRPEQTLIYRTQSQRYRIRNLIFWSLGVSTLVVYAFRRKTGVGDWDRIVSINVSLVERIPGETSSDDIGTRGANLLLE